MGTVIVKLNRCRATQPEWDRHPRKSRQSYMCSWDRIELASSLARTLPPPQGTKHKRLLSVCPQGVHWQNTANKVQIPSGLLPELSGQSGINCRTSSGESIFQSSPRTYALRKTISVRWSNSMGIADKSRDAPSRILCGIFSQR